MKFKTHEMKFEGELLSRGFWLYVWEVNNKGKLQYYIGRTGDSSSIKASSPFVRSARHLDFSPNAKGNTLLRQLGTRLTRQQISKCKFRLIAVGPLFKESKRLPLHRRRRDVLAALESKVAKHFQEKKGRDVIGSHNTRKSCTSKLLKTIINKIESRIRKGKG